MKEREQTIMEELEITLGEFCETRCKYHEKFKQTKQTDEELDKFVDKYCMECPVLKII